MYKFSVLFWISFIFVGVFSATLNTGNVNGNNIAAKYAVSDLIPLLKINSDVDADVNLTTIEFIEKYGYNSETHHVVTSDGYILELHRITGGPKSSSTGRKQPVLLVHGVADSSATWVMMGSETGLGFLLSDAGYDVWLGNIRGNVYSRHHETLNPDGSRQEKGKFWDFSFHESGIYDLPAMIDYVLDVTDHTQLHFIGHSQGTSAYFVMASEKQEYNEKIILMNALSPIAYMSEVKSPLIRAIVPIVYPWQLLYKLIGGTEFSPRNSFTDSASKALCNDESATQSACENFIFLLAGYSKGQLNETMLPVIFGHLPAGASVKQFGHYAQEIKSGYFRQFDYGSDKNSKRYNSTEPPNYNLDNIKSPISLYYSDEDYLAAQTDVEHLISELPNVNAIFIPGYSHADFVWGMNAPEDVYRHIINDMKEAERSDL